MYASCLEVRRHERKYAQLATGTAKHTPTQGNNRQTDRETGREGDRHRDRQTDRDREREKYGQTKREERERQTAIQP
jgi:hypothetical protein